MVGYTLEGSSLPQATPSTYYYITGGEGTLLWLTVWSRLSVCVHGGATDQLVVFMLSCLSSSTFLFPLLLFTGSLSGGFHISASGEAFSDRDCRFLEAVP